MKIENYLQKPTQPEPTGWVVNVVRLPGRLNAEQAARFIGCQPHDIPYLIRAELLKPLARGPRNPVKYFASVELLELCQSRAWLDAVTAAAMRRDRTGRGG